MLFLLNLGGSGLLPCRQIRQRRTHGFALVIPAFLINGDEAGEAHTLVAGAENVAFTLGIDGHGIINGICHLGSQETAPDQLVELVLVSRQAFPDPLRLQLHMGGADGFVGILRPGLGLENVVLSIIIGITVAVFDKPCGSIHGLVGKAQGVGTHVGDEPCGPLACHVHAFVQLLGDHHGLLGGKAQLAGGLLL